MSIMDFIFTLCFLACVYLAVVAIGVMFGWLDVIESARCCCGGG